MLTFDLFHPGYYLGSTHPPEMSTMTQEELVNGMVHEVTEGSDGTKYKCGLIGEIGCSNEITGKIRKQCFCFLYLSNSVLFRTILPMMIS